VLPDEVVPVVVLFEVFAELFLVSVAPVQFAGSIVPTSALFAHEFVVLGRCCVRGRRFASSVLRLPLRLLSTPSSAHQLVSCSKQVSKSLSV
jgi:hypothetical protein